MSWQGSSIPPHRLCLGSYKWDCETTQRCGCSSQHHHGLLWRNVLQLFQRDGNSHPARMPPSLVTRKTSSSWLSGTAVVSPTFTDNTPGVVHINLGTEPRLSYTKHPNPQGLLSQTFLLGYNPKAGQEVPPPPFFRPPLAAGSCTNQTPRQLIIS